MTNMNKLSCMLVARPSGLAAILAVSVAWMSSTFVPRSAAQATPSAETQHTGPARIAVAPASVPGTHEEPEEASPAPTPVTVVGPGPAAPDPSHVEPPAAPTPPATPVPSARRRWTPLEVARARAEIARRREARQRAAAPRRHGDPIAHFTAGLSVSAIARPDQGFEHFELGHTSARYGLFLAYDLVHLSRDLTLAVELGAGFEQDQSQNLIDESTEAELTSQTLHVGVSLRWDVLRWLAPHVRAWSGASLFQLDVNGSDVTYDTGYATSVFGALGAGALLHTPPQAFETAEGGLASLQLGLLVEAGYALRSAIDFSLRTQPDPSRIEVIDASLGRLTLSGPYLRFAGVARF